MKELRRKLPIPVTDIHAALVTHEHKDHCKAAADLMKAGVDVYMSEGTRKAQGVTGHRVKVVKGREQFTVGTWQILPFEAEHDCAEPLGFLLASGKEKLLYLTDSFYCRYRFSGLTHIMLETNYAADILAANVAVGHIPAELKKRLMKSHFSLENVKKFLRANDLNKVREIHLIHLSDGNSDAARFKREVQEVTGKPVFVAES